MGTESELARRQGFGVLESESRRKARPSVQEVGAALDVLVRFVGSGLATAAATSGRTAAPEWMTVSEAAEYLRVGEDTIRGWIASGRLLAGRCGRVTRIRRRDLDDLFVRGECTRPAGEGRPGEPPEHEAGRGPEGRSAWATKVLKGLTT